MERNGEKERERQCWMRRELSHRRPLVCCASRRSKSRSAHTHTNTHTNWHINWQHSGSGLLYGSRKQMQFGLAKDTYFVSARCKYSLRSIATLQNVACIKVATPTPSSSSITSPPWSSSKSSCTFLNSHNYIYSHDILSLPRPFAIPSIPLVHPLPPIWLLATAARSNFLVVFFFLFIFSLLLELAFWFAWIIIILIWHFWLYCVHS